MKVGCEDGTIYFDGLLIRQKRKEVNKTKKKVLNSKLDYLSWKEHQSKTHFLKLITGGSS